MSLRLFVPAVVSGLLLLATGAARAESDAVRERDDRIADLERKVDVLVEELSRVREQVVVPDEPELKSAYGLGPAASKIYGVERGLSLGGYGEMNYRSFIADEDAGSDSLDGLQFSDEQLDRADALRLVLYLGYRFSESIVFNAEIEFEHAIIGEDTVSAESGEVAIEFATVDFLWRKEANARLGLLLMPMGFLNEIHEPPSFHGVTRPDVERRIIPTTWREMGAGLFGDLGESFEYRAYLVNGFNARGFSDGGIRDGRQGGDRALAEDWAFVGRLDWVPSPELMIGGSVYYGNSGQDQAIDGEFDLPDAGLTVLEGHLQYRHNQFESRLLFAYNQLSDAGDLNEVLGSPHDRPIADKMLGGYAEVAYDVWPTFFGNFDRYLAPFLRVEYVDTQWDVPSGYSANGRNSYWLYTPGITFKPHPNVALKLEYRNYNTRGEPRPDEIGFGVGFAF